MKTTTDNGFSALGQLRGKEILLTGSTGFVGKVVLSMLLRNQPDVGHVHCVIRSGKGKAARTRFAEEVLASPVLAPVRTMLGDAFESFVEEKLSVIDSNLQSADLDLPASALERLQRRLDLVIHCAGNTDFTPPMRDSLASNTLGALHMLEFTRACKNAKLVHISTCYVAGRRDGLVLEEESLDKPFPAADGDETLDPRLELEQALRRDAEIEAASRDQVMTRRFHKEALEHLRREHGPLGRDELVRAEAEKCRQRWVDEELRRIGEERARLWGWPNTYTYSKGLAEKLLVAEAGSVRYAIVRPAIIESAVSFPEPGWNEGVNTSAPLIYLAWRGLQNLPAKEGLRIDFIPVDHIAAGILMIAGALLAGRARRVYQLSTSECNPIEIRRIIELTALAHRKMHRKNGSKHFFDLMRQHLLEVQPVDIPTYQRWGTPTVVKLAGGLKNWLGSVSAPAALKPMLGAAHDAASALEKQSRVIGKAVHTFMPYLYENNYKFRSRNILELRDELSAAERSVLRYEPDTIEWRSYWVDTHVPGLHRFTLPELEEKLRKKPRPVHTYADLRELFLETTERYADRTALRHLTARGTQRVTYRKLRLLAETASARLQALGAGPASRVLLMSENRPEWAAAYFGITTMGATAVPVDPALDLPSLERILASSKASVAVFSEKCAERCGTELKNVLAELVCHKVQIDELFEEGLEPASTALTPSPSPAGAGERSGLDRVASLIYTSGTTGTPKGVMLTHQNFTGLLTGMLQTFQPLDGPRFVSVLPLHHTFEFTCGLLTPLSRGGSITYLEELNAKELARAFASSAMTHMVGVPALWQMLARNIDARAAERGPRAERIVQTLKSLNRAVWRRLGLNLGPVLLGPVHRFFGGRQPLLISGGAALPEAVLKSFEGLGFRLLEGYGLTEAAPVLTVAPPSGRPVAGSVGKALPGVEIRVHEPDEHGIGEIVARSPGVMAGYEGMPEETARTVRDGWLHTGDLGRVDRKGNVYVVGRKKDVILDASGENVYPDELEDLYGATPLVAELSVVGLPDGQGGERPAALIVPAEPGGDTEGASTASSRARILQHVEGVAGQLPRHKRLALVRFTQKALPRTATRKVRRGEVVKLLGEMLEAEKRAHQSVLGGPKRGPEALWRAVAQVSGRSLEELAEEQDLVLDLGLDSLEQVELQSLLEERLGLKLSAQKAGSLRTVGDLVDLVQDPGSKGRSSVAEVQQAAPPVRAQGGAPTDPLLPAPIAALGRKLLRAARETVLDRALDVQVLGRAHIPANGRFIAAANHSSHLDTPVVLYALGQAAEGMVTLAAKDYFFDTPLKERLARQLTNLLPLDRNGGAAEGLEEAGRALEAGRSLLLFPEGTRSRDGRMAAFRPGIGLLALRHRMDVLPLHVEGTHAILPKGSVLPKGRRVLVRIGRPLAYRWLVEQTQGLGLAEASAKVAQLVEQAVARLGRGVFDAEAVEKPPEGLEPVLEELRQRFQAAELDKPVTYYLSLGPNDEDKWTLHAEQGGLRYHAGKNGGADCVIKTSADLFRKIVRERYTPDMEDFMTGRLKTNDPGLLMAFQRVFGLG
jgi:long-chain acyl-CoA synthetase